MVCQTTSFGCRHSKFYLDAVSEWHGGAPFQIARSSEFQSATTSEKTWKNYKNLTVSHNVKKQCLTACFCETLFLSKLIHFGFKSIASSKRTSSLVSNRQTSMALRQRTKRAELHEPFCAGGIIYYITYISRVYSSTIVLQECINQ